MTTTHHNSPSVLLVGILTLGVVIWLGVPLIPGIRGTEWTSPMARGVLMGTLLGLWLAWMALRFMRQRRRHRRFFRVLLHSADLLPGEDLNTRPTRVKLSWWQRRNHAIGTADRLRARTYGEATATWGSIEHKKVEEREHFKGIIWAARKVRADVGRKRRLDDLPWLLLIGSTGTGKSTFLHRAGLPFPVAALQTQNPVPGSGATRDCRWWIHHDTVLIETPGRFFSQDSIAGNDADDWAVLLRLLAELPPDTPIKSVLVLVSADFLVDPERAAQESGRVRRRMEEVRRALGADIPFCLVITHMDRIAGFNERFDHTTPDYRHQLWGIPLGSVAGGAATQLKTGWDALLERLDAVALEHLQAEPICNKRRAQFTLFNQLIAFKPLVVDFVARTFDTGEATPPRLVELCLTSAAQSPAQWDWISQPTARQLGLSGALQVIKPEFPRGYFVRGILHQLAIPFALATTSTAPEYSRWRRAARHISVGLILLFGLLALASWTYNTITNRGLIVELQAQVDTAAGRLAQLESEQPRPSDLVPTLDALASAVNVFPAYAPLPLRTGLYQGAQLREAAKLTYERTLREQFLPALTRELADALQAGHSTRNQQREALALYRVMDDPGELDEQAFSRWFRNRWHASEAAVGAALGRHLDVLLKLRLPPQPLNYRLLSRQRNTG